MHRTGRPVLLLLTLAALAFVVAGALPAQASTIYLSAVAPPCVTCVFGDHLLESDALHPSVAGTGGAGISDDGDTLDGARTYIIDSGGGPDVADGVANRGDEGFAMLIWKLTSPLNTVRLYTHQDHYGGGPITDPFIAQDVMEYSVWGSHNGDDFVLLSDVTAFDIDGGGAGLPTYTFTGTAPTVVYRDGSTEFGLANAYTRDYTFGTAYQYYGIRTSTVSLASFDADPEIDAIAFNDGALPVGTVPEPGTLIMLATGFLGMAHRLRRRPSH